MNSTKALAGILIATTAACSAAPKEEAAPFADAAALPPIAEAQVEEASFDQPRTFTLPGAQARPTAEAAEAGGDARRQGALDELALWSDPAFRRQFSQSYIADTEIEPPLSDDERVQMVEVMEHIMAERPNKAAELLVKHRTPASSAVFDFTMANIYFQQERLDEAATLYRAAVDKHPKFRRAWRNMGLIHVRQGQHAKAVPALTKVVELGGGDSLTYGLLGFASSNVGSHLAAESAYRMAILLDPRTTDWKLGLARSFFEQQRYADAVALCGQMIQEAPDSADLWLLQANAYIGLGQPLKAAENFEIVDGLGRSTADTLNMLGDIYVNEELFDVAVASYLRALEEHPQADPARALRAAKVLTARGALAETRALVEGMEALRGDQLAGEAQKDLLKLRARLAVAAGEGDENARVLEELVQLDPLDGEALFLLAQHAERKGDADQALFLYERAASIEGFEADAKVRQAQLLVGRKRYAEALPLLRRAQVLQPRETVQQYLEQVERISQGR